MSRAVSRPTRRTLLAAGALFAAPPFLRRASAAPRRLTVASLLAADSPETRIWAHVRDTVERERPGAFRFAIVPNAALGGERQVLEGMRLGSVQASLATAATLGAWAPQAEVLDLPFAFRDAAHLAAVLDGALGRTVADALGAAGFVAPAFVDYGARNLLAREPLVRPAAMAGRRIRVIDSALHRRLWQAFGAVPTAIPIPEAYNALSTGVVDTMDLTIPATAGFKLYEVAPVTTETGHIRAAGAVLFAAAFWDGLDAGERAALTTAARSGAALFRDWMAAEDADARARMLADGGSFVPAETLDAWRAGAKTVWGPTAAAVGGVARVEALLGTA